MTVRAVATGRDYPQMIAETDHVEPAPRRVRGTFDGEQIFDTTRARYVWEWAYYPQYYIPVDDIDPRFLVDEHHEQRLRQGTARRHGLRADNRDRPGHVRASLEGVTLAETSTPVLVFETGLPTRYYFDRTEVAFSHLVPSDTQTACPYKGVTSGYWSVLTGDTVRDGDQDLAWAYDYPTGQLLPIAGLVAFYNEKIDIDVDGLRLPRANTHFFK